MSDNLNPFLAALKKLLDPERLRRQRIQKGLNLGREATSDQGMELLRTHLRGVDDRTLGELWREWQAHGHCDLRLEAEQELERRKRHSQFR